MKQPTLEFQSLIDAQENPFVLIDPDYRIVAANRAYLEAYGVRNGDVVGRKCHEVSHHSPVPCHQNGENCPHQAVLGTGQPFQALHIHFDRLGRPEHVRLKGYPVRASDGSLYLGEAIFPIAAAAEIGCEEMRMIGRSPAFLACIDQLTCAAGTDAPVLLLGESGVGKELAAHYIHQRSARNGKPFLALDCASIPETLFESEMFGHERGAFSGCVGRKRGLIELADGGTLFLDEVGELPFAMQSKLLRVLETGEFRRIGGHEVLKAHVRIVCATNRNLLDMVDRGTFRKELYYRISVIDVTLPPLRARRIDIPALAEALLARLKTERRYRLTGNALAKLVGYDYPGNVRELRNILVRAAALSDTGMIDAEHIIFDRRRDAFVQKPETAPSPARRLAKAFGAPDEAQLISELLDAHNGHRRTVATLLGISERTLYRRLRRYRLGQQ